MATELLDVMLKNLGDPTARLQCADLLDDADRPEEATLLRDLERRVCMWKGEVSPYGEIGTFPLLQGQLGLSVRVDQTKVVLHLNQGEVCNIFTALGGHAPPVYPVCPERTTVFWDPWLYRDEPDEPDEPEQPDERDLIISTGNCSWINLPHEAGVELLRVLEAHLAEATP